MEEFYQIKDGFFQRRWWDNVFCNFCGNELTPNESYGESPKEFGICYECLRIIFGVIK